jgi:hypothetical protein
MSISSFTNLTLIRGDPTPSFSFPNLLTPLSPTSYYSWRFAVILDQEYISNPVAHDKKSTWQDNMILRIIYWTMITVSPESLFDHGITILISHRQARTATTPRIQYTRFETESHQAYGGNIRNTNTFLGYILNWSELVLWEVQSYPEY